MLSGLMLECTRLMVLRAFKATKSCWSMGRISNISSSLQFLFTMKSNKLMPSISKTKQKRFWCVKCVKFEQIVSVWTELIDFFKFPYFSHGSIGVFFLNHFYGNDFSCLQFFWTVPLFPGILWWNNWKSGQGEYDPTEKCAFALERWLQTSIFKKLHCCQQRKMGKLMFFKPQKSERWFSRKNVNDGCNKKVNVNDFCQKTEFYSRKT